MWGDDGDSPRVELFRLAHERAGIHEWNNDRVARLCRLLKCTPYELAAAAGVYDRGYVDRMRDGDAWPPPIALHFDRFEKTANQFRIGNDPEIHTPDIAFAKAFAPSL